MFALTSYWLKAHLTGVYNKYDLYCLTLANCEVSQSHITYHTYNLISNHVLYYFWSKIYLSDNIVPYITDTLVVIGIRNLCRDNDIPAGKCRWQQMGMLECCLDNTYTRIQYLSHVNTKVMYQWCIDWWERRYANCSAYAWLMHQRRNASLMYRWVMAGNGKQITLNAGSYIIDVSRGGERWKCLCISNISIPTHV